MAGLAQYSELFSNPLFTETIKEIPEPKTFIGSRFLPVEETFDIDFNETVMDHRGRGDMAAIVDSGAELPFTDRDPLRRVSGAITDIGQSYVVTKKEMGALMDKGNPGKKTVAEKQLLNKAATVKTNIDARIEWMRWQALGEGAFAYNKQGINLGVDFGVPAGNKVTAAVRWDDTVGAPTILADYEKWVQDYIDLNGVTPDTFVTSIKVIRTIMNDTTIRKQITGYSDKLVDINELNDFLAGRQLPKMESFDTLVTYRDVNNGTRTQQRLLNEKKGVFLIEGGEIGAQLMGPTVENEMNPGIYARTFTMERPMREIVEVVAASFPKILVPELIKQATILA